MPVRCIEGLKWARLAASGPGFAPSRPRGAKRQGVKYEKELAKAIPDAIHGQWIEFCDRHGTGWAQPDLLLRGKRAILVLEAKLSWTFEGHQQVDNLYCPLCEAIWQLPAFGVVVTRGLRPMPRGFSVVRNLNEALAGARAGRKMVLHWIGVESCLLAA